MCRLQIRLWVQFFTELFLWMHPISPLSPESCHLYWFHIYNCNWDSSMRCRSFREFFFFHKQLSYSVVKKNTKNVRTVIGRYFMIKSDLYWSGSVAWVWWSDWLTVDISCYVGTSRTSRCPTLCPIFYTKTAKTSTLSSSSWTGWTQKLYTASDSPEL